MFPSHDRFASDFEEITQFQEQIAKDLEEKRQQFELDAEFGEIQNLLSQGSAFTTQALQQRTAAEIQQRNLEAQTAAASTQLLGSFISAGIGASILAFCWVARAIFGEDNPKWIDARNYIVHGSPRWFFRLYRDHGEKVAKVITKYPILKIPLIPLFNWFAYKGEKKWVQVR